MNHIESLTSTLTFMDYVKCVGVNIYDCVGSYPNNDPIWYDIVHIIRSSRTLELKSYEVSSYILVYLAGIFATRENFIYVQVVFGIFHGIGTGTGKLNRVHFLDCFIFKVGHVVMW